MNARSHVLIEKSISFGFVTFFIKICKIITIVQSFLAKIVLYFYHSTLSNLLNSILYETVENCVVLFYNDDAIKSDTTNDYYTTLLLYFPLVSWPLFWRAFWSHYRLSPINYFNYCTGWLGAG